MSKALEALFHPPHELVDGHAVGQHPAADEEEAEVLEDLRHVHGLPQVHLGLVGCWGQLFMECVKGWSADDGW